MAPLLRQVRRKRLSRQAAYQRRAGLALRLLQDHGRLEPGPYTVQVSWGDVLPRDPDQDARRLIDLTAAGLKSRTAAMAELGERDPAEEWARVRRQAAQWQGRKERSNPM